MLHGCLTVIFSCTFSLEESAVKCLISAVFILTPKKLSTTTGANNTVNQSEFLAINCKLFNAREKSRVQGFGFGFYWLKNWRKIFKPITRRTVRDRVISFDGQLKAVLSEKKLL